MELRITELEDIKSEIKELKELLTKPTLTKEWFTDEDCWNLKGGGTLSTYRSNRFYQCKGGIPDGYVGGRKVWNKKSVEEWLPLTDEDLAEYHAKYKTGATKRRA